MYERILDDLFLVGSGNLTHEGDCQVFLAGTGKKHRSGNGIGKGNGVLIDAGADPEATGIIQNIEFLDIFPSHLILTHGHIDHIGGAHALKDHFGLTVIAHELDAPVMERYDPIRSAAGYYGIRYPPVDVDVQIAEDTIMNVDGIPFKLLLMPGHTPGSIAVLSTLNGKKVLFGQDIHGPFNPVWGSDRQQHSRSLRRLIDLRVDILCEGHFGIIKPATRVRTYIEGYL